MVPLAFDNWGMLLRLLLPHFAADGTGIQDQGCFDGTVDGLTWPAEKYQVGQPTVLEWPGHLLFYYIW